MEGVEVTMFIEADGAAGPGGGRSMSQRQQVLTTDAGGRFHLPGPFASGARFRAIVNPGEFAIAASDARTPEGSSSLVLAPITVDRLRSIAGQVVDTAGNPVAGATVLNWGNPTPLTGAVTGTSGRFHLGSLPRTTAFLFVDAPGYRFHTSSLSSGRSTIDIVVRRDDQPPERAIATLAPPIMRPEAIDLAAKVIKPYSDTMLGAGSDPEARSRVVEVLARIDPDGAWQKCQAGEAPWDSDAVRRPVARQRATTSVADGDAIARTIKSDYWRLRTRIDLVEGVPMTDREARFKLLGEIGVDASQMENGGLRIHFLMDVAARSARRRPPRSSTAPGRRSTHRGENTRRGRPEVEHDAPGDWQPGQARSEGGRGTDYPTRRRTGDQRFAGPDRPEYSRHQPGRGATTHRPHDLELVRNLCRQGVPPHGTGRSAPSAATRRDDQKRCAARLRAGHDGRGPRPSRTCGSEAASRRRVRPIQIGGRERTRRGLGGPVGRGFRSRPAADR